jgi:hypothetical protein
VQQATARKARCLSGMFSLHTRRDMSSARESPPDSVQAWLLQQPMLLYDVMEGAETATFLVPGLCSTPSSTVCRTVSVQSCFNIGAGGRVH